MAVRLFSQANALISLNLFLAVFPVQVQTEQTAFVLGIIADDDGFADIAPVDRAGQRKQLSQLAFEVENVAVGCFEIHVSLCRFREFHQFTEVKVVNGQTVCQNPSRLSAGYHL